MGHPPVNPDKGKFKMSTRKISGRVRLGLSFGATMFVVLFLFGWRDFKSENPLSVVFWWIVQSAITAFLFAWLFPLVSQAIAGRKSK
jgi:hypothetical protein